MAFASITPMPPRDQWDLELRQYYRDLIQLRRQVIPSLHPPRLLWLDDGAGTAQWQIGDFDLLVNCGVERSFATGGAVPVLASQSLALEVDQGGMVNVPEWSAVVLRLG